MTIANKNTVIRRLLIGLCLGFLTLTAHAGIDITYIHNDALGSAVAGTDEQGNVKWRSQYAPYGEERLGERSAFGIRSGYTGHRDDPETGLTYMGARYYSPAIGRFMGVDPAGTDASDIYSFNRYAYANNNPYKYVDPDGRNYVLAWELGGKAGAFVGTAAEPGGGTLVGYVVGGTAGVIGLALGIDAIVNMINENSQSESGDEGIDQSADKPAADDEATDTRRSRDKRRFRSTDSASDQFENIQREQNRRRKQGDSVSIDSIEKSRQRDRNALRPQNIDLDNLDDLD
jgi:RHS repeat-associated protein